MNAFSGRLGALATTLALGAALAACGGARSQGDGRAGAATSANGALPPTTLTGVARDAKAGAIVVETSQGDLYVEGLAAWPPTWNGQHVVVSGRIVEREGPACVHDPEPCQGIAGTYRVVTGAAYRLE